MKAWQCKFHNHGFQVDMNNETPFECVPNALFKMYGNRDAGRSKFIAPVANGGIDYVKSILDSFNVKSDLNNGVIDNSPKGYTPLNISSFCIKFKILCFGYDYKMERFMTNNEKEYDIKFNYNLPAFVFYFNDNHIYLINDKQMRHSLLNNNGNKSDIISLLSKERKVQDDKTQKRCCS